MSTSAGEHVVAQLGALPLFRGLAKPHLERLSSQGHVEHRESGWVYRQGERAQSLFILLDGHISVSADVGAEEVEVFRTDQPGACGGATHAHLGEPDKQVYRTSMRALRTCRLFVLPAATLAAIMREWFPLPVHLQEQEPVDVVTGAAAPQQRDRLLALGAMASSLTHELNNPSAAARAAAVALTNRVRRTREALARLAATASAPEQLSTLLTLQERVARRAPSSARLSGLEIADRQDQMATWLEEHGIRDGWDLAPTFVQVGLDMPFLNTVVTQAGPTMADDALRWLNYALETDLLLQEIDEATARISTLLRSVGVYGQTGRDQQQLVDVNDLLDATLLMFRRRLADGHVQLVRDYDRGAPRVTGFAAELNQVWTNLIDNAVDALKGGGTLTIRTRGHLGHVRIEIIDDGPGIPADIRAQVFDPFFSTKPVGEGTGLGLDIAARIVAARHGGTIDVQSERGRTCFLVTLPVRRSAGPHASAMT